MEARRAAFAVALALVLVACTGPSGSTTTISSPVTTGDATSTTVAGEDPRLRLALPRDADVVSGRLDSGLAYYLRYNDSPGGRAELRLVVDAGSVQEDPDQAGIAHFLEHMMFNGTERFPRNELIDALEAFGPRFGPDINAHTTFDETVYELSLATDDEDLVQLGIDVLREWATRATLTETDVVQERGVILDEWRLRAQGFNARVNDLLQQLILPDTSYEGHLPIGTADSIRSTSPAQLRRFYDDLYRPDRMAVVAVGDFDLDQMEEMIIESFGDIEAAQDPRELKAATYESPSRPRAASFADEEAASAGVTVIWPVPSTPLVTVGDYQRTVALSLGLEILTDRLSDDALLGSGPLLSAALIDFDWTRAIGARGVDVQVRAKLADEGMEDVLIEMERIRREGITDAEFQRAITRFASSSQQLHAQQESTQDTEIANQIVAHHFERGHLMSPDQRFKVESDIVDLLTKADMEAALTSVLGGAPVVLVVAPDDEGLAIPSEERILAILEGLPTVSLGPRGDEGEARSELMQTPAPALIAETTVDPDFGFTTLVFGNGATVYLWESDIASQGVLATVEGFGGTSLIDIEDLPEAFLMTGIVERSGVADVDVPTLQRFLTDRVVSIEPWISETRQGLIGESSTKDVETLMQLIYLIMTAPRFDATGVDAVLDEMRTLNASRADLPDVLFDEALNQGYYGDDPRYFVLPTEGQLEAFDVARAEELFHERFGDAGEFAFAFVGDFDVDEVTELAARYIGNLPGDTEIQGFVDNQPLPPRKVQVFTVEAGAGEQGQVGLFFTNELEPEPRDRVTTRLLELIVSARLRVRIREELSATYSIFGSIDLQRDPDPFAEAFIQSTGDPTDLQRISDEVLADLAGLQANGPTDDEFSTAIEQLRDEFDLYDNGMLADGLITAHLYPDQPVSDLTGRVSLLEEISAEDVRRMAGIVFNLDQRIEVRQVPRS